MAHELTSLAQIVSQSAAKIEALCAAHHTSFPSLHTPSTSESEAIRSDPEISAALTRLVAAADQIVATALAPATSLFAKGSAFHVASAIRVACYANVAEVLRDAGSAGLHVDEITKHSGIQAAKLARILRLLATHHIFREVSPDVFCNNSLSSMLDTGKTLDSLRAAPQSKHEGTSGLVAFMEHGSNLHLKASAFIPESLFTPESRPAFNLAFKTDLDLWGWMELPENLPTLREFGTAMHAAKQFHPDSAVLEGFDWKALLKGSLVVDVGGGIGSVSLILAKALPDIRLLIQDRAQVVEEAKKFWALEFPDALSTQRVDFQIHDFFDVQPVSEAAVFFLHYILHDWADTEGAKILQRLRAAARPDTKLIIADALVPYACEDVTSPDDNFDLSTKVLTEPPVLIPNLGIISAPAYTSDISMLAMFNGVERTLGQFRNLLRSVGWNIVEIHRSKTALAHIVASPV